MKIASIVLIPFLLSTSVCAMEKEPTNNDKIKCITAKLNFPPSPEEKETILQSPRAPLLKRIDTDSPRDNVVIVTDKEGRVKKLTRSERYTVLKNQCGYNISNFFRNFFCYCRCGCHDYEEFSD